MKMFVMFERLELAISKADNWMDIYDDVCVLKEFASKHFSLEQTLMRMFGFNGLMRHIATHDFFFSKLQEMERRSLELSTRRDTIAFFEDWSKRHILKEDKMFADFILAGALIVRSDG